MKRRRAEHRMMQPRQAVERQHADRRRQRREQDRQLERDHREGRQRIERPAADIDRIIEVGEELHGERERAAEHAAEQAEPEHAVGRAAAAPGTARRPGTA